MAAAALVDFRKAAFLRLSYVPLAGALAAVAAVAAVRRRPGSEPGPRQPGTGAADRGDPAAAGLLPCRLLRAAMGAAASGQEPGRSARAACLRGCTCRVPSMSCRWWWASARRCCSSCCSAISDRRCSCRASSSRCTRSRARGSCSPLAGAAVLLGRLCRRIPGQHLGHADRARAHVAVAVGQRGARRRSDRAVVVGRRDRRLARHRPRLRRHALSAGRSHRSRPRRRSARNWASSACSPSPLFTP